MTVYAVTITGSHADELAAHAILTVAPTTEALEREHGPHLLSATNTVITSDLRKAEETLAAAGWAMPLVGPASEAAQVYTCEPLVPDPHIASFPLL